jgi:hypothetical protein
VMEEQPSLGLTISLLRHNQVQHGEAPSLLTTQRARQRCTLAGSHTGLLSVNGSNPYGF